MRILLMLSCLIMLSTSFAMAEVKKENQSSSAPKDQISKDLMSLFQQVLTELESNYVEEISREKLIESALNGMLSLDPHSNYVNQKDFLEFKEQAKGQIIGIGMEFINENGLIKVIAPIEDAPAAVAGLKSGDFIFKINGEAVFGMTTDEAVKKLRGGPVGSEVSVSIYRPGKDPFDLKIKRDIIKVKTVKSRVEDNVGYIRISSFMSEKTINMVKEAIDSFKKTNKDTLQGIVLDLRNNAGGQIEQAVGLCSLFLTNVEVVSTRGRGSYQVEHFMAGGEQYVDPKLPLVVLINGGSASASEIVAGALQDHKRAIIMGTKSFGKASVQIFKPVLGDRAIKYTIARYYTPLGRSIQAQGIIPDILVDYMKFEKVSDEGRFREKDYKGALKADPKLEEIIKDKKDKPGDKPGEKSEDKKAEEQDYPLLRAFELIRSLAIYNKVFTSASSPEPATKTASAEKKEPTVTPPTPAAENTEWEKNISAFENPEKKPTLSIVLHSLGLKKELAEKSIFETSKDITLAFSPYTSDLKSLCKKAREKKHEILMILPLEPNNYPKEDPGPKTLLTRQTDAENLERFNWVLNQGETYVGLINLTGSRFSSVEKSLKSLIKHLTDKKIPYVDATPTELSTPLISTMTTPHSMIDKEVLESSSQEEVNTLFTEAIALAKAKGHATLLVPPNTFVLKKLIELDADLKKENVLLSPISQAFLKKAK